MLLSFLATLGLSTLIFQNVLGHEGIGNRNVVWMFIFLVALGVDYNIYIMSRVREEVGRSGLVEGTRRAISRTGGVITSAGIILAGTFSVLTTLPLRDLGAAGLCGDAGCTARYVRRAGAAGPAHRAAARPLELVAGAAGGTRVGRYAAGSGLAGRVTPTRRVG